MTADDVVERIRKLLRLAEDAGATEAEAASALERANALLIRHNLTTDSIAVSAGDKPVVTEDRIRTGWAGSWRGSLVGILARHNLCSPSISRQGRVDTVVLVGRPANMQATLAMFDWIAAQLERFTQQEWVAFDQVQRAAMAVHPAVPWCPECEDCTETYRERGHLYCLDCDGSMLPSRPLVRGFTWKTAFYRGALLRIQNRLYEQRQAQQQPATKTADDPAGAAVTALVLRTGQDNDDYIARHFGRLRDVKARRRGYHAGAYERGQERGDDVSLAPSPGLQPGRTSALPKQT